MIRRFKELAETRTNHAEDEFAGSSVDSNVAGATTKLQATTVSVADDEEK